MAFANSGVEGEDPIFPGEGWFLYWKTSSSLWKVKLQEFANSGPILVPINWSFHSETGEAYDFANYKAETDLRKLAEIAKELNKKMIFLIPLTSLPFLPNGGIPAQLARMMALSHDKMAYGLVDANGNVNKIYSFFDPRVYQSYRKFVWEFGQYLTQSGINLDVVGISCGHVHNRQFCSYLEDSSKAFDQSFGRFLEIRKNEEEESPDFLELSLSERENWKKLEFTNMIKGLYYTSAKECLGNFWCGELRVAFLGGSSADIIERNNEHFEHSGRYFQSLIDIFSLDIVPSSILLPNRIKKGGINIFLKDLINSKFIYSKLEMDLYEDEYGGNFIPLNFFEIYQDPLGLIRNQGRWNRLGIFEFLDREYRGSTLLPSNLNHFKGEDFASDRILFVLGQDLKDQDFKLMLKIFLNGGKIFIDKTNLNNELKMRLEGFFLENSIANQKINFVTEVVQATLGDGMLIIYEGAKIDEVPLMKKLSFWQNLINFLKVNHLKVQEDPGLYFHWRTRSPRAKEIKYSEIRRVGFYNPTSYKKKAKITGLPQFEFLKIIDQKNTEVVTNSMGIEIELFPGGSVSLDYGLHE